MKKLFSSFTKVDITPPTGYLLNGHIDRKKPSENVHDPLYLKVLTVFDGENRIVIITSDLLGFDSEFVVSLRKKLKEELKIEKRNVILIASHTHTGPIMKKTFYQEEGPIPNYLPGLLEKIIYAIKKSIDTQKESEIFHGKTSANIGIINRRKKTENGVMMLPNFDGPIDTEVNILWINDKNGKAKGVLVNYSCHPTTLSTDIHQISADYPGVCQREIEKFYKGSICLFTNGCCGDVRPAIIENNRFKGGNFSDIERMGKLLAESVIKAGKKANRINDLSVSGMLKTIKLPFEQSLLPENSEKLEELYQCYLKENIVPQNVVTKWKNYFEEKLKKKEKISDRIDFEIQKIKIGDIILIGLSGEIMTEIGIKIKT